MKIEARNLLAEAMLEALDDPEAAAALRCLAAYCRSTPVPPTGVSVAALCTALPIRQTTEVAAGLRRSPLLSWQMPDGKEVAVLIPPLAEDYDSTVAKLQHYALALSSWVSKEGHDDARTIAVRKAMQLFNHQLFFEVHEILEEQWKEEEGDIRFFLQGLIQIAVAFHHLDNNNFRGATALLRDGLAKISPHQPQFLDIEVQNFVSRLERCQQELHRLGPEHYQQFPKQMIPTLTFVR